MGRRCGFQDKTLVTVGAFACSGGPRPEWVRWPLAPGRASTLTEASPVWVGTKTGAKADAGCVENRGLLPRESDIFLPGCSTIGGSKPENSIYDPSAALHEAPPVHHEELPGTNGSPQVRSALNADRCHAKAQDFA